MGDLVLLDHPADAQEPRSINCYLVEVQNFSPEASGGADAKRFKIDPQHLLYSLRWMHNATPPDLHLQLVKDPGLWFDFVGNTLLGALSEHDPDLRERLAAANAA